jgi:hypothetical protein
MKLIYRQVFAIISAANILILADIGKKMAIQPRQIYGAFLLSAIFLLLL